MSSYSFNAKAAGFINASQAALNVHTYSSILNIEIRKCPSEIKEPIRQHALARGHIAPCDVVFTQSTSS